MPPSDPSRSYHTHQPSDISHPAIVASGALMRPKGGTGREAPPLGILALFSTTKGLSEAQGPAGGREQRGGKRNKEGAGGRGRRRIELQDTARALLPDEHRIQHCLVTPVAGLVGVLHHPEHGSASYAGLQTCGNAWACPVCAAKIGARRATEVEAGAANWRARGGHLYMLTLTLRHQSETPLAALYGAMVRAWGRMTSGRAWSLFKRRIGLVGQIVAREITHGGNGWHPHIHILLFVKDDLTGRRFVDEQWLARRWVACLADEGQSADIEHGTDLRAADNSAALYIAKMQASWSVAGEITGALSKAGRKGNRTPAQLLEAASTGDSAAGQRYTEYVTAVAGSSWLRWSPGLRELCGLVEDEPTDEELAAAPAEEPAGYMLVLTREQWRWVRGNALRGELLEQASGGDAKRLQMWLINCGLDIDDSQLEHGAPRGGP